ncbi:MAG TPA: prolyl oligopeptidase family serine peptidase [Gemmatimonadales bacterium]
MRRAPRVFALLTFVAAPLAAQAPTHPSIADFMSSSIPSEVVAARKAERIAWIAYERGMRNAYGAVAPAFAPVKLTNFTEDNGVEISNVRISDDGLIVVFQRGTDPNRVGWIANPTHDPKGQERTIWAARSAGGAAWRVAEGGDPALSPDGKYVLFVKDSQIYRARVTQTAGTSAADKGEKPYIKEWGQQTSPVWSPDGLRIVFVSTRTDHAFIGVYDVAKGSVIFLGPSVDFDGAPAWSADGKHIAFTRRPGLPFGRQTQAGTGGIGNPGGPGAALGRGGRGGRGGAASGTGDSTDDLKRPGLFSAKFAGGYTLSIFIGDVATGQAKELWHNGVNDSTFANIPRLFWAGNNVIFPVSPQNDEWDRYYSIPSASTDVTAKPVKLTTTDGLIEGEESATVSPDGKTLYYATNAGDIERRHIWSVPTAGGTPRQLSTGEGIEVTPAVLPSGKIAVRYAAAKQPESIGIVAAAGGAPRIITSLPKNFPVAAHVVPQIVMVTADDSLVTHDQLFLPADLKAGERRPAIIFVHGGPVRQMMPGYHYMEFYHEAYAVNQWLQSQGYIVLSVNYRSGIGYGRSFRFAPKTGGQGNAEYKDVIAAGRYLQTRADVDPKRVGIWGLSYGGVLTSQALARNSDVFVAGVDLAGVHLWQNSLDTGAVSYQSSTISAIDTWKSPVLLEQGDDDRNVQFSQMVGLVQLLRAHNVYYELMVHPDETHEMLLHSRWLAIYNRMDGFLDRFVRHAGGNADGGGAR